MATPTAFKNCALCRQDNDAVVVALIGSDNYIYIGQSQVANQATASTWGALVNTAIGAQAVGASLRGDRLVQVVYHSNTNNYMGTIIQATKNGSSWTSQNTNTGLSGIIAGLEADYRSDGLILCGLISNTGGNTSQGNFAVAVQASQAGQYPAAVTVIYGT